MRAIRGLRGELNGKVLIVVLLWVEGGVLLVELAGAEGGAVVVWFSVGLGVERGEEGLVDKVLVVVDRSGHGLVHGIVDREGFVIVTSQIITTHPTNNNQVPRTGLKQTINSRVTPPLVASHSELTTPTQGSHRPYPSCPAAPRPHNAHATQTQCPYQAA